MTHAHSLSAPDRRDAAFPISRRDFLAASTAGLAALAAAPSAPPRSLDDVLLDPRRLYWNTVHVRWQLGTYREHFLPWLLRRNQRDEFFGYVGLAEPDPADLSAFRITVDGLLRLLDGCGSHRPEPDLAAVLRPARTRLCDSARRHVLGQHEVDGNFVASRCLALDRGLIWSWRCSSLGFFLPDAILASYWEEIRNLLGLPASAEPSSLFRVKPRRLIRSFRRLPADDYFRLAYGLVQLFPPVPARFFAIPDQGEFDGARPSGSSRIHSSPGIRDRVSYLLGVSLEFLANDDFLRLWPLVKRVEMCGSWLPFIAGQVLDVLYQKTLVLTWLHLRAAGSASRQDRATR
jgi:hypothetical protein